jgi:hypothetical protein
MAEVSTLGKTVEGMKASTRMIANMDSVPIPGLMVVSTSECGRMANNMERADIDKPMVKRRKESGRMESVSDGLNEL